MEAEIQAENGAFLKGRIESIMPEGGLVKFEIDNLPSKIVPWHLIRLAPLPLELKRVFKDGDDIEVYGKSAAEKESYLGWYPAKFVSKKGDFVVVQYTAPNSFGRDVIGFDKVRPLNRNKVFDGPDGFRKIEIPVPEDLQAYSERPDAHKGFADAIGNVILEYSLKEAKIVVTSAHERNLNRAKLLSDVYFRDLKQKVVLMQRFEDLSKQLQESGIGITANRGSNNYMEEFFVPLNLMGLAIGAEGANIRQARAIKGVVDIQLTEQHDVQRCLFQVYAESPDVARQARAVLEFGMEVFPVRRELVGKVIGKNGKVIQDIVDKSRLIRAKIDAETGASDGSVSFVLIGTMDSIENAKFLLQYHIDHLKNMEDLKLEAQELSRQVAGQNSTAAPGGRSFAEKTMQSKMMGSHLPVGNPRDSRPSRRGNGRGGFGGRTRGGFGNGARKSFDDHEGTKPSDAPWRRRQSEEDDTADIANQGDKELLPDQDDAKGRGRGRGNHGSRRRRPGGLRDSKAEPDFKEGKNLVGDAQC